MSGPRIGRIGDLTGATSSSGGGNSSGRRIATLRDIGSSSGPSHGHRAPASHDDDDDDDDEDEGDPQTFFAGGGQNSGISIEGPGRGRGAGQPGGDVVRDLLERAARGGPAPEAAPRSTVFSGGGHLLGGEDFDSRYIPDAENPDEEPAIRRITFWRDGFSVEDGDLLRYDDPQHAGVLAELHAGRAPPSILNIEVGQPVELRIAKRTHENYVPPPNRPTAAFTGSGNRLGSPVPGATPSSAGAGMPGSFPSTSTPVPAAGGEDRASMQTRFEVDPNLPQTRVQVRLADGTRLTARMNLSHTVGDLRGFIDASRPENASRAYTVNMTFPNRVLDDEKQSIEKAGLANSVVVQRWV